MVEKHFAVLKYEDHKKLMMEKEPDSSFSLGLSESLEKDVSGTTNLFPMEPHRTIPI